MPFNDTKSKPLIYNDTIWFLSVSDKEHGTLKMSFNIQINLSVREGSLFVSVVVYLTSPGKAGRRPEGERSPLTDWTTNSPL